MSCSMERWVGKPAIVTGSSEGIGYAITEILLEAGVNVVGMGRTQSKLDTLKENMKGKKGQFYAFCGDVSKEEDVLSLFKYVKENVGPVHILVNNAGVLPATNLTSGKTELWRQALDTNILGFCMTTREAVKDMRANKVDGHIINMSSIAFYNVKLFPNISVYTATKRAITALTETLRNELNSFGDKIKISSIRPGYVKTHSTAAAEIVDLIPELDVMPCLHPNDVANAALYILSTPPHVQIHELTLKPIGETLS